MLEFHGSQETSEAFENRAVAAVHGSGTAVHGLLKAFKPYSPAVEFMDFCQLLSRSTRCFTLVQAWLWL